MFQACKKVFFSFLLLLTSECMFKDPPNWTAQLQLRHDYTLSDSPDLEVETQSLQDDDGSFSLSQLLGQM